MDSLDAVYVVLQHAGGPLHYKEITKRVLARELWTTTGKTPWATINARLAVDIKERGTDSRFVRVSRGVYELSSGFSSGTDSDDESEPANGKNGDVETSMSFTDAAERILSESVNQEPLHYAEITELALELGLICTKGRTPAATMYAMILTEIRRQEARGETPRFDRHGPGLVGLSAWLPVEIAGLIEERNREVRRGLLERARSTSPADFENLVGQLLVAMGFDNVEVTKVAGDGGIDARGTLVVGDSVRIRMAVQAKRWKRNVTAPVVQTVRGSLGAHEQALIITTSDFSAGAKKEAQQLDAHPVALISGEQLAILLPEHEIGARSTNHKLYTLEESDSENA